MFARIGGAALFLAFAVLFALYAYIGHRSGTSTLNAVASASRSEHPKSFRLIQLFLIVMAAMMAGASAKIAFGGWS